MSNLEGYVKLMKVCYCFRYDCNQHLIKYIYEGLTVMLQDTYKDFAHAVYHCIEKDVAKQLIRDKSECLEKGIEATYQCRKVIFDSENLRK